MKKNEKDLKKKKDFEIKNKLKWKCSVLQQEKLLRIIEEK